MGCVSASSWSAGELLNSLESGGSCDGGENRRAHLQVACRRSGRTTVARHCTGKLVGIVIDVDFFEDF